MMNDEFIFQIVGYGPIVYKTGVHVYLENQWRYVILTIKSFRSSFMDYFHLPLYQPYYQAH